MAVFEAGSGSGKVGDEFTITGYETIWKPEPKPRGEVFAEKIPWYREKDKVMTPFWKWGQKEEYIGEKGILLGFTAAQIKAIGGHKLTDNQKEELKRIYKEKGGVFASAYRTMMAMEYHEARAMLAGKEPAPPEAITEALMKLKARVGEDAAQEASVRTFYTTEGKPHVMALTKQEAEDWGAWRPPQELIDWLYPETKEEIFEMPLEGYEQYIKTLDPDYLLTPKERRAKRGREISWKLERATSKVEEIKSIIGEGGEPTQELIDAEAELEEASEAMASYFAEEESVYDQKFYEYLASVETTDMLDLISQGKISQEKSFNPCFDGCRPATIRQTPCRHPRYKFQSLF